MIAFFKKISASLFFITMLVFIIAGAIQNETLQIITKPLLIPILMLLVWVSTPRSSSRNIMLVALFFSFLGDVFLLFESKRPSLFIPGLVCFLLTHILYIIYFLSIRPSQKSILKTAPYLIPLVAGYGLLLLSVLFPHLGDLKIPVAIDAVVIMSMLLASMHIYNRVIPRVGMLFITGAIFFVLSDSLLAINKFYLPLGNFSFLVMVTYCTAQWLIVMGFIKNRIQES